jgi:TorA maturation chaperone TorD
MEDTPIGDEDIARAHCYALVSRLFYRPPDADLLGELAGRSCDSAPDFQAVDGDALAVSHTRALAELQSAARAAEPERLRQEYDDTFVSAGKALVSPYTSGYTLPHAPDRHLLQLREKLGGWGLARREAVFEVEDHVSAICDVMRWLIERGHMLETQREFFDEFVLSGVTGFCSAIEERAESSFYRSVARYTRTFMAIESEAFQMDSAE